MSNPQVALEIAQGDAVLGTVVLELDEAKAPATVANFLQYTDDGYFDGTIFHRVIRHFMIQGGGYTSPSLEKRAGLRGSIRNEAANGLKNSPGTIAMARTSDPHSATSQFFINVGENRSLDHPAHDGWGYCVFGRVVQGMEIVDKIKSTPTTANRQMGENSLPVNPPVIKSAKRVTG